MKKSIYKLLSSVLVLLMITSSLPAISIYAADVDDNLGQVSVITGADQADVNNDNQSKIVVTYNDEITLDWSAKDEIIERNQDGWWVGIKMTAPTGVDSSTLENATYQSRSDQASDWGSSKSFWEYKDSEGEVDVHYITLWAYVNEQKLNDAIDSEKNLVTDWQFDWDNNSDYEQMVSIEIDPSLVKLKKDSKLVYPSTNIGNVDVITSADSAMVNGNKSNIITVEYTDEITLDWSQANTNIGRNSDNWWAGIKVIAPTGRTIESLKTANYKTMYYGESAWSDVKSFWQSQDSDKNSTDESIERFIQLWACVNENIIDMAENNNETIENKYQFDWDGDGVYEQLVVFSIDPDKVVLDPANLLAMDKEAPVFSDVTEDATVWIYNKTEITGTVIDQGTESNGTTYTSGIEKVEYAKGNETANRTEVEFNSDTNKFSFEITEEFEGDYYIFATDKAGNESDPYRVRVMLDKNPPQLSGVAADITDWTNQGVKITGEALDSASGIDKIVYTIGEDGEKQEITIDDKGKTASFEILLEHQSFEGIIYISAFDNLGLESDVEEISVKMDDEICIVADKPVLNPAGWTSEDVVIKGTVSDKLSGIKEVFAKKANGNETVYNGQLLNIEDDGKKADFEITIPKQDYKGTIEIYCEDNAGNKFEDDDIVKLPVFMDVTKPVVESATPTPDIWTNDKVKIGGEVSDNLSGVAEVKIYKESDGKATAETVTYNPENNEYEYTIDKQDYEGNYIVYCVDKAGLESDEFPVKVYMDITNPDVKITTEQPLAYNILKGITFGFFDKAELTITVKDTGSGLKTLSYESVGEEDIKGNVAESGLTLENMTSSVRDENGVEISTYKFTIDQEYRNKIKATVYDNSGNSNFTEVIKNADDEEYNGIIVDTTDPVFNENEITYNEINSVVKDDITKHYYSSDAKITFSVNEEYFFESYYNSVSDAKSKKNAVDSLKEDVELQITKDGADYYNGSANPDIPTDKFTAEFNESDSNITVTIPTELDGNNNDGDYVITLSYTDLTDHTASVTTDTIVIDTKAPVVEISYENEANENRVGEGYFLNRTATITVEEHNFTPEYITASVIAKSIKESIDTKANEQIKTINDYGAWKHNGDVHTFTIEYTDDAIYQFALDNLQDNALNEMVGKEDNDGIFKKDTETPESFVVDKASPSDVVITYSDSISVIEDILSNLFWFYNPEKNNPCEVTLTTTDITSGIQYFTYSYNGNYIDVQTENIEDAEVLQETNCEQDEKDLSVFTYNFEIPAQFRGKVTASATDNSGNITRNETESENTFIVDTDDPIISVDYSTPANTADKTPLGINYYSDDVTVTVTIDEENFMDGEYAEDVRDVIITANILGDDDKTVTEEEYQIDNWTRDENTNKWVGSFTLSTEGDYTLNISYDDKSGNSASYTNDDYKLTIDKTAPVIEISYDSALNCGDVADKQYFSAEKRTANISITEHNFDVSKDYLSVSIIATDVNGKVVKESEIEEVLTRIHDISNWKQSEKDNNVHSFSFNYYSEANYTFEISAKDLACRNNVPVNYNNADAPESFTLDTIKPNDIRFGFVKTALSKILNVLTFGVFFNDEIKVRIEATDDTAGLWKASINIKDEQGESISVFDKYDNEFETTGANGSTEFVITKENLDIIKEFKGSIYIKIYDKAGNCYDNYGELENGSITLVKSVKPIDDENTKEIDNYLVYEGEASHTEHSSISIVSAQLPVSTQTKQTDVNLSSHIKEQYLEDAQMTYKNRAPLYNSKVDFTVDFVDDYSGIAKAQVVVYNNNSKTEYINSTYDLITQTPNSNKAVWTNAKSATNDSIFESASATFTVTKNANDIVIVAIITDNAGNISYDYYNFGIDTTNPKIDYRFTTDGKSTSKGSYNNKVTTFTVNVSERNFPLADEVVGVITYTVDGVEKSKTLRGKDFAAANNAISYSDNQKYTYVLSMLTAEGQYEDFVFVASDRATNESTVSPTMAFYYDHTNPVIKIVSDKYQTVNNGYFYQDSRVITITVTDRYFGEKLFTYNNKAGIYKFVSDSEAGKKYHTNSRTFTYTFTYETTTSIDCELTQFAAIDRAGNRAANVPSITNAANFVVDGKTPQNFTAIVTTPKNKNGVSVSGSDYKVFVEEDITLTITCSDENLANANISNATLICRSLTSDGRTKNVEFKLTKVSGSRDRIVYSVSNLDQDGFYELTYTVTDDSGKVSAPQTVSFAICRNGAVYNKDELDKITNSEVMYNDESVNSISFRQYSASANTTSTLEISSDSVQFPRRILELGVDYIIDPQALQDSQTLVYTSVYKLLRHAFELENGKVLDGIYTIKITPVTTDANQNTSDNAPSQTFTVKLDATDPNLVANLDYTTSYNKVYEDVAVEANADYRIFASSATLNLSLSDSYSGIDENSIEITWNGVELEYETDGQGNYTVNLNHNNSSNGNVIVIGALDEAGNNVNTSFTVKLDNNFWLYVALGGFIAIGAIVVIILIIRRRKLNGKSR